jgi:hypothetical protein
MLTYETGLTYGPTVDFCEGSDETSILMKSLNFIVQLRDHNLLNGSSNLES